MFDISTQWKKSKETGQVTSPLRVVLLKCFVTELQARLEKLDQDEVTKAKEGWATQKEAEGLCWPYFQYDPQTKQETVDGSKSPIPHARAIDVLKGILVLLSPETLRKFHATRPLAETYESEMISFLIHVALRGDLSEQLYRQLLQLEHSATMFLMEARLRRERIQRTPLANHVASLILDVNVAGTLDSSSAAVHSGLARVRSMVLRNPDNQCYQNTFMMGLIWSTLRAQGRTITNEFCCSGAMLGRFAAFCNKLLHLARPTRLMSHIEWTSQLRGWRRPMQQHDVAEFAAHVLRRLRLPAFQGTWNARPWMAKYAT